MNFYAALISYDHGLDAMGPVHYDYNEIYTRELAQLALPKIFANEITSTRDDKWEKLHDQAVVKANEQARKEGTAGDEMIRGIFMRKMLANVQGEIVFAPIDKDFAEEVRDIGGWKGAKVFLAMASHILKGKKLEKLTFEDREDLLDEINAGIAMEKARAKRSARRRK